MTAVLAIVLADSVGFALAVKLVAVALWSDQNQAVAVAVAGYLGIRLESLASVACFARDQKKDRQTVAETAVACFVQDHRKGRPTAAVVVARN